MKIVVKPVPLPLSLAAAAGTCSKKNRNGGSKHFSANKSCR